MTAKQSNEFHLARLVKVLQGIQRHWPSVYDNATVAVSTHTHMHNRST